MMVTLRWLVFAALLLPFTGCSGSSSSGPSSNTPNPSPPLTPKAGDSAPTATPKAGGSPGTELGKPEVVLKAIKVFLTDSRQRGPRLTLSRDGSQAVTVIEGGHLWDTVTGKELPWNDPKTAESMKEEVESAIYSVDGSHIWVTLANRIAAIDAKTHKINQSIPTGRSASWVLRLSPGLKYVATDEVVYDVQAKSKKYDFAKDQGVQSEIAFGHDGRTFVGRGEKAFVRGFKGISLWNLDTKMVAHTIEFTQETTLEHQFIACSPTSNVFALRSENKDGQRVEIHDLTTGALKATFGKGLKLSGGNLAWSPDGKLLTVVVDLGLVEGHFRKAIWLLDATSGKPIASLSPAPTDDVETVVFSGDGSKLAILTPNPAKNNKMDFIVWDMTQLPK